MSELPVAVLFDLDGTVVDSADAILGCLAAAFDEAGVVAPAAATDRSILGPPLARSLPPLIGDDATGPVLDAYRRIFAERGPALVRLFPGIDVLLAALHEAGVVLGIATSKSQHNADLIVAHLGLDAVFATVVGDTPDGARPTKAHVIGEVLDRLGNPAPAVMVGDRDLDLVGARAHGLPFVGAGWGYGRPGELAAAGAELIAADTVAAAAALGTAVPAAG